MILTFYNELFSQHRLVLAAAAAILGLFIGSFLNVVGIRLPRGQSVVKPPSHCSSCKHRLAPLDLVPVFSYIVLRGKCRYCKTRFSPLYAMVEALTAVVFGFAAWHFGWTPELAAALTLASLLIAAALGDWLYRIIPNRLVYFGVIVGVSLRIFIHPLPLWNYAAALLIGFGLLYAVAVAGERLLRKESMGGGDIKLFAMLGLYLGIGNVLLALFLASLFGLLAGIVAIRVRRDPADRYIPFGPFIALGAYAAYVWGDAIISGYTSLLGWR